VRVFREFSASTAHLRLNSKVHQKQHHPHQVLGVVRFQSALIVVYTQSQGLQPQLFLRDSRVPTDAPERSTSVEPRIS
jgi:hypothetical protein